MRDSGVQSARQVGQSVAAGGAAVAGRVRQDGPRVEAGRSRVGGVIVYPAEGRETLAPYAETRRLGVPLVMVDRYRPDLATDAVTADNLAAGRELTAALIRAGHRTIATLWDETEVTSVRDRLRITGVRTIVTAPEGQPLVVVRVDTSEPGLYGLGCATFAQRYAAVAAAVDEHVAAPVLGRHPADIEDITRLIHDSSYWRSGPVLNNALSGIDQALWDIAGKRAGMPVYELLGGRSRAGVEVYTHAAGATIDETLAEAESLIGQGYRSIRLQVGGPGPGTYGAPGTPGGYPRSPHADGWDPERYLRSTPALFAPEVRAASPVPIAVGGQLSSIPDAARLIRDGGVDLLRLHTSSVGGLTPIRKLVAVAELLGVRTAFHSPGGISPIGVAANLAVDVSTPAFGYQESHT